MIDRALQAEIAAMNVDERMELVVYIERTIESESVEISEQKKNVVRSRAAELAADPSIGLTWDESTIGFALGLSPGPTCPGESAVGGTRVDWYFGT